MKTLLFSTDFSENATHAIRYGYYLASEIKANILLFNDVLVPTEATYSGLLGWPVDEFDIILKDSTKELIKLKTLLEKGGQTTGFHPAVNYLNQSGILTDIINNIIADKKVDLVVIGTHGGGELSTLLLGNHSRNLIDGISGPLLLIPPAAKLFQIKKIAFASDFTDPEEDIKSIALLTGLANPLKAEILLKHIYEGEDQLPEFEKRINQFINDLAVKVSFSKIKYTLYKSNGAQSGLEWLCENGDIDILAMMHRSHTFIDSLFRGSQTQKIAGQIPIPLLVFPCK